MPSGDEFQAQVLADKIARESDMGFGPSGTDLRALTDLIEKESAAVAEKLRETMDKSGAISIGDMFEMQMSMNQLSQLSEMSTSIVSAANTAIQSMARNVKG